MAEENLRLREMELLTKQYEKEIAIQQMRTPRDEIKVYYKKTTQLKYYNSIKIFFLSPKKKCIDER